MNRLQIKVAIRTHDKQLISNLPVNVYIGPNHAQTQPKDPQHLPKGWLSSTAARTQRYLMQLCFISINSGRLV